MLGPSARVFFIFCLSILVPNFSFGTTLTCKYLFSSLGSADKISIFLEPELKQVSQRLQEKIVSKLAREIGTGRLSEKDLLDAVEKYYRALDKPFITGFFENLSQQHNKNSLESRQKFHARLLSYLESESISLVKTPISNFRNWMQIHSGTISLAKFFAIHATTLGTVYQLTGEVSWFPVYLPRLTSMAVNDLTPTQVKLHYFNRVFSTVQRVYYAVVLALATFHADYLWEFVNASTASAPREEVLEKIATGLGTGDYAAQTESSKAVLDDILGSK
ncbi:MAG: hypothetical protein A4S09_17465 [Proteobacteria bacterium SG_bin7]|nr:MAG: hypothetical protein A4S09_17465 [Proteobacteria bacterium SG_bin7]